MKEKAKKKREEDSYKQQAGETMEKKHEEGSEYSQR
jgi:hypothetical protein